jgi:flagellar motor switch protein FliN/FliY
MAEQDAQAGAGDGGGASNDAATAALAAAQAAIAAAKAMNTPSGGSATATAAPAAISNDDIAAAMAEGQAQAASATPPIGGAGTRPFEIPSFDAGAGAKAPEGLDLLGDVNLHVKIELGRTRMLVEDVLRLGEGSVIELDKLAGDPVDVFVNDRPVARGEVLVLNDNFCVRINEILSNTSDHE